MWRFRSKDVAIQKVTKTFTLGDDHFILRGGGGGADTFGRDILFISITCSAGKNYIRVNRGQNIYFQPQQIFEKAKKKKKKKKKKKRGGGG